MRICCCLAGVRDAEDGVSIQKGEYISVLRLAMRAERRGWCLLYLVQGDYDKATESRIIASAAESSCEFSAIKRKNSRVWQSVIHGASSDNHPNFEFRAQWSHPPLGIQNLGQIKSIKFHSKFQTFQGLNGQHITQDVQKNSVETLSETKSSHNPLQIEWHLHFWKSQVCPSSPSQCSKLLDWDVAQVFSFSLVHLSQCWYYLISFAMQFDP